MFGVFQTLYFAEIMTNHSASAISWIGSTQSALLFFGSLLSGPLFDMGYFRSLLFMGTFLTVSGMMLTSICHSYWQFFLAQGVTVGLGFGCLFLLCVTAVSQYFTSRRVSGVRSILLYCNVMSMCKDTISGPSSGTALKSGIFSPSTKGLQSLEDVY